MATEVKHESVHGRPLAPNEAEMWYVEDTPDGTTIIECQACGHQQQAELDRCRGCGYWLVYRPWLEW